MTDHSVSMISRSRSNVNRSPRSARLEIHGMMYPRRAKTKGANMTTPTSIRILLFLGLTLGACAASQPEPATAVAADNGQPKMQAAIAALQHAKAAAESASPNKGGHREQAIGLIQQAIEATSAGMQYASAHPTEVGEVEGPAPTEPVDEVVPGAERQPHMAQAMVDLREARRQLREAKHDKGGNRVKALEFVQQAMVQLRDGINFANAH
jgi:hypothetical protein